VKSVRKKQISTTKRCVYTIDFPINNIKKIRSFLCEKTTGLLSFKFDTIFYCVCVALYNRMALSTESRVGVLIYFNPLERASPMDCDRKTFLSTEISSKNVRMNWNLLICSSGVYRRGWKKKRKSVYLFLDVVLQYHSLLISCVYY